MPSGGARWSRLEKELQQSRGPLIAGVDEVGRGPLAGPVVACAVIMPAGERAIRGVDDSKLLAREEREKLAARIRLRAVAIGIGAASVREIDTVNIYHAAVLAMRRAIRRLGVVPDHVLLDGNPIRSLGVEHTAIVGGDGCCHSIACASIIAKVTRDRLMRALARRYPHYRWETNCGYGTSEHHAGLASHGLTPHHRHSFAPVRALEAGVPAADAVVVDVPPPVQDVVSHRATDSVTLDAERRAEP